MNLPDLLNDYATFNHWANQRIVDWLRPQPEALLDREVASSFPTLRSTLLHIWSAEDVWLLRIQGAAPTSFLAQEFKGSLDELFAGLLRRSAEFRDYLHAQEPGFLASSATYFHSISGNTYTNTRAEMALHCLQHSTYHRGQIVTMARGLGLTQVPQTDFLVYVRNKPTTEA